MPRGAVPQGILLRFSSINEERRSGLFLLFFFHYYDTVAQSFFHTMLSLGEERMGSPNIYLLQCVFLVGHTGRRLHL